MERLLKSSVYHPKVCYGKPCIRGARIMVYVILENLADGMSVEEIIKQYQQLTKEGIDVAIAYQAE
ncbi:MAG: DUF433 domain-containing protein [Endomicrobia bacterium]|nr:DUF433 domain-containing protein [Endomicrobiia bacterium]